MIRLKRAQDSAPCDPDRLRQRSGAALHQRRLFLPRSRCHAVSEASASAQPLCQLLSLSCADRPLAVRRLPGRARDASQRSIHLLNLLEQATLHETPDDTASDLRRAPSRPDVAADDNTQGATPALVFRRRHLRANRQRLVSQPEDGADDADIAASDAAPAGPDDTRGGQDDAPRRASGRRPVKEVERTAQPTAPLQGVPALGCSKCRMAKRGCGKCRHDRWTALKASLHCYCCNHWYRNDTSMLSLPINMTSALTEQLVHMWARAVFVLMRRGLPPGAAGSRI